MALKAQQTEVKKMKGPNRNNIGILVVALLLFSSCGKKTLYDTYIDLPEGGWRSDVSFDFEFEFEDNQNTSFDYLIGLRNNNDYLYANIFFFAKIEDAEGIVQYDTLQYLLAEPNGKWLGTGVGEIKHNLFVFKKQQSLKPGSFTFSLSHGMRDDLLLGLEDLGLLIEESN